MMRRKMLMVSIVVVVVVLVVLVLVVTVNIMTQLLARLQQIQILTIQVIKTKKMFTTYFFKNLSFLLLLLQVWFAIEYMSPAIVAIRT